MEKSSTRRVTIYINGKEVESSPSFPLFARSCFAQHARSRHLRTRVPCRAHIPVVRGQGTVISKKVYGQSSRFIVS
ncbi:MAG: hypothetical protein IKP54_11205 [Bacteroidales bacterium]|nr:hypothetical protein [Bacteroidales bacterium]